LEEKHVGSFSS